MEIYPAVDVRGGRVVHARRATGRGASVFGDDPAAAVARLFAEGAHWVHVVDLDYAFDTGSNHEVIRGLLAAWPSRVQIGGGLRSEEIVADTLDRGAARAVIGCSAAATEPDLVERLVRRFGSERLAVAIDVGDHRLIPRGIARHLDLRPAELAARVRDSGIRTVLYTNVQHDGTLVGPDVLGAQAIAGHELSVVVSGGIGTLDHLRAVRQASLAGAIIGRALHEGCFTLDQALACAAV